MLQMRSVITFALIVIISAISAAGHWPKKCAEFNEYCQLHSDCCSNSCLTYLYRCTQRYSEQPPYNFYGESAPMEGSLQDVINWTLGTIGSAGELEIRRKQQHAGSKHTSPPILDVRFGDDTAATTENDKTTSAADDEDKINNNHVNLLSNEISKNIISTNSPQVVVRIAAETTPATDTDDVADAATSETKASEAVGDCKAIGSKCYHNEECCTQRCHGFLHQCVT